MKINLKNFEINDCDLVETLKQFLQIEDDKDGYFEDVLLSQLIDRILSSIGENDEDTQEYATALKNLKPIVDGQWI